MQAADFIEAHVDYARAGTVSFFETVIRELGGLLSAHALSGRPGLLVKAEQLAERLAGAFQGESPLPSCAIRDCRLLLS